MAADRVSVTMAEVLASAAADLGDVSPRRAAGGAIEYLVAGRSFAVLEADGVGASFGLAPAVAAAAVRTPDVLASSRGEGWVTIRGPILDPHAVDRVTAWFESSRRLAGGG
jgi:hypothetical protein